MKRLLLGLTMLASVVSTAQTQPVKLETGKVVLVDAYYYKDFLSFVADMKKYGISLEHLNGLNIIYNHATVQAWAKTNVVKGEVYMSRDIAMQAFPDFRMAILYHELGHIVYYKLDHPKMFPYIMQEGTYVNPTMVVKEWPLLRDQFMRDLQTKLKTNE